MLKNLFRATVFAASIMSVGGLYFAAPANAEMVLNRGNSADPESLDRSTMRCCAVTAISPRR